MILSVFIGLTVILLFLSYRIYNSVKPVNLWANDNSEISVADAKAYNKACSKLIASYSVFLFCSGILVSLNHIACIVIGYLSVVFSSLALIVIYSFIESKHRINP